MQTNPTLSRAQLRSLCEDTNSSPRSRLDSAAQLLEQFGATARNLRIIKRVAKQFEKYVASSSRTQQQIRWQAEKLKARIEKTLAADAPLPDDAADQDDETEDEPMSVLSQRLGGVHLLPPDEPDNVFWDCPVFGSTRRALFCMSWGFPVTHSRSEMISDLHSDPTRLESKTLRLQLWACSREKLDQQFERDSKMIRDELAARGLPDSDQGRDHLAVLLTESGTPLFEFRPREETIYEAGPVLARTAAGELLDAIDFVKRWPMLKANHTQL